MSQLKRKINSVNKKLYAQEALLAHYHRQLRRNPDLNYMLMTVILTGFTAGFIYSKKRTLRQVIRHFPPLVKKLKTHYRYIELIRLFLY